MTTQKRIDHFNMWPEAQEFQAEMKFKQRVMLFDRNKLFFPYQMIHNNNKDIHISISYLLDAVDSLPFRPDHAFDWTWRAFEYLAKICFAPDGNITEKLRKGVTPSLLNYFSKNQDVCDSYFELLKNIPIQTCEYLLKRTIESGPYTFTPVSLKSLSSYAKRMLFEDGNLPVVSISLQKALDHLSTQYNYQSTVDRRNGASLLRRLIRGEKLIIGSSEIRLTNEEILFFAISGLGYAFRNDRAHAKSIAPFQSSSAKVSTYAHCWFMFLLIYETTFVILHTADSPLQLSGGLSENFNKNNKAYVDLFAKFLNS